MGLCRRLLSFQWFIWALMVSATTVVPPSFDELVGQADFVVKSRVSAITTETRLVEGRQLLFTKVELEVLEVIAGEPPTPLVLTMLGGRVGDSEMWVSGAPRFAVGDEDILFIQGNGVNYTPLYALMHGRYPVRRDEAGREFVVRNNEEPLHNVEEVSEPMDGHKHESPALAAQPENPDAPAATPAPQKPLTPAGFIEKIRDRRAVVKQNLPETPQR